MIKNNENICIGITVWNGEKTIKKSLFSLLKQNYRKEIYIVILDNRSEDQTVKIVKKLIKNNKRNNIKIKIIIDKRKRNIVAAQQYLAKKYFYNYKYCMLAMDDDIYHENFISSTIDKLKKNNLDLVYTNYMMIDLNNNKFKVQNKPLYSYTSNLFTNIANFIIYRNIVPIFFGVYKSKPFLELLNFYNYFDNSRSNQDNLFIFNFLLSKKIGIIKRNYFFFLKKNRNEIEKNRKTGPTYWKTSSLFTIFIYQFNFSKKMIFSLKNSNKINTIEKFTLLLLIFIIYFQKTFSYVIKRILF